MLHGAATVTFEDRAPMTLSPGDVVRLHAGQRTVWTVTETLRKVYISLRSERGVGGNGAVGIAGCSSSPVIVGMSGRAFVMSQGRVRLMPS